MPIARTHGSRRDPVVPAPIDSLATALSLVDPARSGAGARSLGLDQASARLCAGDRRRGSSHPSGGSDRLPAGRGCAAWTCLRCRESGSRTSDPASDSRRPLPGVQGSPPRRRAVRMSRRPPSGGIHGGQNQGCPGGNIHPHPLDPVSLQERKENHQEQRRVMLCNGKCSLALGSPQQA